TDVLGRVVEVVAGKPLGQVLAERVFRPLKMTDTGFVVPADKKGRLAQALAIDPDTGKEIKLFDPTTTPKFECGGGCGVSTAGDYNRDRAIGTGFRIEPREELTVVFMAQAPGPIRVHYRQLLKTLVLQAIE